MRVGACRCVSVRVSGVMWLIYTQALEPDESVTLKVTFCPQDLNSLASVLTVTSTNANTLSLDCVGQVSVAQVGLPNLNVDFGTKKIGVGAYQRCSSCPLFFRIL